MSKCHQSEMAGGIFIPIFKKGKVKNMKFTEALENMKRGIPMKLPSWGGYWCWDDEKQTIIMYTKDNERLDIRETQRVEYTLLNICSDEWISANGDNCSILGGTPTFSFGDAVKYMKRGLKVKRQGWNGKNQYVALATHIGFELPDNTYVNPNHIDIGNKAIAFFGTSGVQIGWLASQADMLADDWVFYEPNEQKTEN